ncbi:MAG: metallophosphoesterase [Chitinophagales bacterium]|nr:metallophosphoesterase [Chitinophagales bacterium]MDW8393396.1 metallophosphoesterase [Chitinophagales bacterium]
MTSLLLITAFFLFVDLYAFQAVRAHGRFGQRKIVAIVYWLLALLSASIPAVFYFYGWERIGIIQRSLMMSWLIVHYVPRMVIGLFLLLEDSYRIIRWLFSHMQKQAGNPVSLSRKRFLSQTALIAGGLLSLQFVYGMARTAYHYRIVRQPLRIKGLPRVFEGMNIVQISDLHVGSFMSRHPVEEVVERIHEQKPDAIFFTGDMVNNRSDELLPYLPTLRRLRAPLGIFAIRGNHDFGDYYDWGSEAERQADAELLKQFYEELGWHLLNNRHYLLERQGHKLAIAGVDNWSAHKRFRQYGNLEQALTGTEDVNVRLLLSHDPSHWDAQVLSFPLPVAATFSGHTHGFQFGVELPGLKWSPAQWLYPRWAGLYEEQGKYLYVNRGIGFVGYSGRVGIRPEITVFQLIAV